jgi:hypothetical protein
MLILIATAALIALPSAALAKGVTEAQVCGATGCAPVDDASLHAVMPEGDPTGTPPTAAPFVNVRLTIHDGPHGAPIEDGFTYVPSAGVMRPNGAEQWIRLYPDRRAELNAIVAATTPLPASQLTGVAPPPAAADDGTPWWPLAGAIAAALALLALGGRYATSAVKARPRASKSAN